MIKSFLVLFLVLLTAKIHDEWISHDVQFHQYQAWLYSADSDVVGIYKWKASSAINYYQADKGLQISNAQKSLRFAMTVGAFFILKYWAPS